MPMQNSYEKINRELIAACRGAGLAVDEDHQFFDREYGPTIPDVTNYFFENFKDRILSIDGECIEDDDAYSCLLVDFLNITRGDVVAENVSSEFEDDVEVLTFSVNGDAHSWQLSHDDDYIDDRFLFKLFELVKLNSEGQMIIDRMDDFVTVIYVPKPVAQILLEHYEGAGG